MSTDQRTTNKTAPSVSHRRRQSPKSFRATCLTASSSGSIDPDLVTAAKKTACLGCIQRSRDSYLVKLATLILRIEDATLLLNVCPAYAQTAGRPSPDHHCLSDQRRSWFWLFFVWENLHLHRILVCNRILQSCYRLARVVDFDFAVAGSAIAVFDPPAPLNGHVSCVDVARVLPWIIIYTF